MTDQPILSLFKINFIIFRYQICQYINKTVSFFLVKITRWQETMLYIKQKINCFSFLVTMYLNGVSFLLSFTYIYQYLSESRWIQKCEFEFKWKHLFWIQLINIWLLVCLYGCVFIVFERKRYIAGKINLKLGLQRCDKFLLFSKLKGLITKIKCIFMCIKCLGLFSSTVGELCLFYSMKTIIYFIKFKVAD